MTGSSDREGPPTKPGWTLSYVAVLARVTLAAL